MAIFSFSLCSDKDWGRPVDTAFFDAHDQTPGTLGALDFRHLLLDFWLRALRRHIIIDKHKPNSTQASEQGTGQDSDQVLGQVTSRLNIHESRHSEASISSDDPLSSGVTVGKSKGRGD